MKTPIPFPLSRVHSTTLFLLFSLLLSACSGVAQAAPATQTAVLSDSSADLVVAEGSLVPARHVDLAFAGGGRIQDVLVAEGDPVKAGDVLARLDGAETLLAQEAAANLEIVAAQQALDDLQDDTLLALALASAELEAAQKDYDTAERAWNGKSAANPTDFETALKEYLSAEKAVRDAQKKVNAEADQPKDSAARQQANEDLQREQERRAKAYTALLSDYENPQEGGQASKRTDLLRAITRLETARQRLADLNGGADPDVKALLDARLQAARAAQSAAQEGLSALEIRAPWNGTLVFWDVAVGEVATPGLPVGSLVNAATWYAETTDLTENGVVAIAVGDPVAVTVDALPGETFSGVVESIQGRGEKYQGDMTYKVRIRLDDADPRWYWNMSAKVSIGK